MRGLPPVLVVCGVALLARPRAANIESPLPAARMSLLLCVIALCTLVQFPFFAPIYFCYVAPLVALTALAVCSYARPAWGAVPGLLVAFFAAFAVLRVYPRPLHSMGL